MPKVVGIDTGGTFTDFVYIKDDGSIGFFKSLSTPKSPEDAVIEGLRALGSGETVIHATTLGTNAIRGQFGIEIPKLSLVTTRGFKGVIEIGRQNRPKLYDIFFEKPKPLVERDFIFEANERIDAFGRVLEKIREEQIEEIGSKLKEAGVSSVAISFLHSYINPSHEKTAERILSKYVEYVSPSYLVSPEPREYERTSSALVNAALMPIISKYIERLNKRLKELNVKELLVMSSSGGIVDAEEASKRPVQLVESGPAAGVVATAELCRMMGINKAISFDMGGTTAKAGTIVNYEFEITSEYEVGGESNHGRMIKGSGYSVRFPFIDLAEVSAGGGTIIWRDDAGALRIGPKSAGADPGPACYDRGGKYPTLTDANLVLGRIGESLLGGKMKIRKDLAIKALSSLGEPVEIANRSIKLADLEMARAIRLVTVERGIDPEEFVLFAFGGAGPQFAAELANEIGIKKIVIPPHPGVFSALGLLMADWRFEDRTAFPKDIEMAYRNMEEKLLKKVGRVDYFIRYADVRYVGQGWELTVPVGSPADIKEIKKTFNKKHFSTYGFMLESDIEVVLARVFAVSKREKPLFSAPKIRASGRAKGYRKVYMNGEWIETPIYCRYSLDEGFKAEGPLLIDEYDTTTFVPSGWRVSVGAFSELILERM
ncbi:hydantoinase/oxoprolinase family protein [Fervidicoccus sp.]|uniref:hydantoinase/oxoprolinase family protein n=1 Tax=Fervidicoccus sp. TaxID=2060324 RepID=UPI003D0EBBA0